MVHDQAMDPGMHAWTVTRTYLEMVNAQLSHVLPWVPSMVCPGRAIGGRLVDEPTSVYGRRDIGTRPTHESWNQCLDSDMYTSRNGQRTIVTRAAMGAVNGVSGEGGVSISSGCPYYPSCPTRNWYMTCLPILTRRDRRNGMSSSDSAPRVSETSGTLTWLHETVLPQADAPVGGHTRVLRTRGDDTRPPLPSWKESLRRHACMTQSLQRKQHI